jgi:methylmalonyl-CoA mutase cobalamin-binding subunit
MSRITSSTSIEELAAIVSQALEEAGVDAVLTGGAVVSVYTRNEYEAGDLDFIFSEDMTVIAKTLQTLGFERKGRKFWGDSE